MRKKSGNSLLKDPEALAYLDMLSTLRGIQHILWPDGDADHEWSSETLDAVAVVMHDSGLGPARKEKNT